MIHRHKKTNQDSIIKRLEDHPSFFYELPMDSSFFKKYDFFDNSTFEKEPILYITNLYTSFLISDQPAISKLLEIGFIETLRIVLKVSVGQLNCEIHVYYNKEGVVIFDIDPVWFTAFFNYINRDQKHETQLSEIIIRRLMHTMRNMKNDIGFIQKFNQKNESLIPDYIFFQ